MFMYQRVKGVDVKETADKDIDELFSKIRLNRPFSNTLVADIAYPFFTEHQSRAHPARVEWF